MHWVNQHTGWFFLFGLFSVVIRQWHLWKIDKHKLLEIKSKQGNPGLEKWPRLPIVSVLVAAWNEANHIQALIESFISLRYPHKQLVLVAGGTDGTYEIVQRLAGDQVVVLQQFPGEGKQRALRKGLERIDGEIVYLTDADCMLENYSFESVLFPIALGQESATSGTSIPRPEQMNQSFVFNQAASQLYSAYQQPDHFPGLLGRNSAILKESLLLSRGLDVDIPSGTDYGLAKMLTSAGIKIRQVPSSQLVTEYPVTIKVYYRQQSRWLRNVVQLGKQFSAGKEVRSAWLNALVGSGMLLLPVVSLIIGPIIIAIWVLLMSYAWLSRLRYAAFTASLTPVRLREKYWLAIPYYLIVDFTVWAASIPRMITRLAGW